MILVDECRWPHRGMLWCHMVSDHSIDELHAFADIIEVPRRGFQGDHYDLPEHVRHRAVLHGALEVGSREIVARLRSAGLRLAPRDRRRQSVAEIAIQQATVASTGAAHVNHLA
ncbi:MAG: DUF4031 domain-containing protein [Acidimicrobiales bacterium]